MGGKGSGGRRPGAGRKPKDAALGELHGSRRTRARKRRNQTASANQTSTTVANHPTVEASSSQSTLIPDPPGNLTLEELAVWNELAPLAEKEGTLLEATRTALRDLCEAIVLKRKLLRAIGDDGVTVLTPQGAKAAHPLLTQFRGLMQRVEAGMVRFKLAPMGKEIQKQAAEQPSDAFAEFDDSAATDLRTH